MVTSIFPVNESDNSYLYFVIINFALKKRPNYNNDMQPEGRFPFLIKWVQPFSRPCTLVLLWFQVVL